MSAVASDRSTLGTLAREAIGYLASFERPSASDGERRAADWIAARLRSQGLTATVEQERAHGTYWWPLGIPAAIAGLAAVAGGRRLQALAGTFAAAAIADDVSGGRLWFRRSTLPRRTAYNVVAYAGDENAKQTVVFIAHHDAAHWSLLFAPQIPAFFGTRFPGLLERSDTTPPVMFPVFGGPLLVALGGLTGSRHLRRAGAALSLGTAATMAEIGSRSTVPGANDNLSGVAVLLGVARLLAERPVSGVRVMLVSTGAEESFMEGMQGFAARHFAQLPRATTSFVCLDTVGSPELTILEGEGMLRMRDYDEDFKELVASCAREAGVHLRRGLRFRNATDGLLALKAGYRAAMVGSINRFKAPANYHWPTDTAENVDYETVTDATLLCEAIVRRLAADAG
jgi:hypothetical protein